MSDIGVFDDYPDDGDGPDDADDIEQYAAELTAAVTLLGVPVLEPGDLEP